MTDRPLIDEALAGARVHTDVFALRRDYRALLVAVDGIVGGPSNDTSEELLTAAETAATSAVADRPVTELPSVAAWRDTYRAFGAKPNRTRNSLEALLRRAVKDGLPRIDRLTDTYNAISVLHQIPLGGEDLAAYRGPPRLVRATGHEPFTTTSHGEPVTDHPDPGEVVWCDDTGVTCRRWNWRQTTRTLLTETTTTALFILDALHPTSDDDLVAAADDLTNHLQSLGHDVTVTRRLLAVETSAP